MKTAEARPVFSLLAGRERPGRRRNLILGVSVAAHVLALLGAWVHDVWAVAELPAPGLRVSISLAPPPPPAAGPKGESRKSAPKPKPRRMADAHLAPVPVNIAPRPAPAEEPAYEASDEPGDEADGVVGGVVGGAATGVAPAPAAVLPPPPRPDLPVLTETERKRLVDRYLAALRQKIAAVFSYPPAAAALELEGAVLVRVTIDRSGKLLAAEPTGRCAHAILCEAALRTVNAGAPFAPLPPELGDRLSVAVPLTYRLE